MSKQDWLNTVLALSQEGRAWCGLLLPAFVAWLIPSPKFMKRKEKDEEPKS